MTNVADAHDAIVKVIIDRVALEAALALWEIGYVVAPREANDEMIAAAGTENAAATWRAMMNEWAKVMNG